MTGQHHMHGLAKIDRRRGLGRMKTRLPSYLIDELPLCDCGAGANQRRH